MSLEQTSGETKWIFRYLRADRNEVDIGPYKTREEAQKVRDEMSSFGAMCTSPIEVSKEYQLYQEEPGRIL